MNLIATNDNLAARALILAVEKSKTFKTHGGGEDEFYVC